MLEISNPFVKKIEMYQTKINHCFEVTKYGQEFGEFQSLQDGIV
jgi:hypothetical protein